MSLTTDTPLTAVPAGRLAPPFSTQETTAVPGPRGPPIVGNTHQWARDPLGFHERLADYGRVARYDALGDKLAVAVTLKPKPDIEMTARHRA